MKLTLMNVLLLAGFAVLALSFWSAHRKPGAFNAFDLVMEDGKVSRIAVAFMLVLAVTTWVIVDMQMKGKLTEGYFTMYGTMWVLPLVAKVVFQKNDMPGVTLESKTTTTVSESTIATAPAPTEPDSGNDRPV